MALAIFLLTYVFIAGVRLPFLKLDRPGGALLGAVLMVVFGVVSPEEVFNHSADPSRHAVDMNTIVLLLGMMLLAAYMAQAEFFRTAGAYTVRLAHTPRLLLAAVAGISALLSAFLVNDTVCLMLTPLVLAVVEDARLPPVPYLLAVCMGSNSGSVATFTGNPQNMLIQGASKLSYASFAAYMALPALLSTLIVIGALLYLFKQDLRSERFEAHPAPPPVDRPLLALTMAVLLGVVVAFFAGLPMSWSALAGAAVVMTLARREPRALMERVDFVLLLFFASLFVVVYGVNKHGWAAEIRALFTPLMAGPPWRETVGFAGLTLVASNLFSNVPFVMLARSWVPTLQNPELGWHVLALCSTLAGNLTLIGSVANLIVFEAARDKVRMTFMAYLRIGLPVTLLSFMMGLTVLLAEHSLF
ncbi:MAG: SLC13 family permease [Hyalangium sp.]|uniref:SLC13 family permease n=1 Tax=Hyalangium sp. TaxID=2028555 RepID=UPI003899A8BD